MLSYLLFRSLVGVDASFDELASLVEELLEDAEKGRGRPKLLNKLDLLKIF